MLVLSRKETQQLLIGDGSEQITVTILKIAGNKVRIGVTAPANQAILRGELVTENPAAETVVEISTQTPPDVEAQA